MYFEVGPSWSEESSLIGIIRVVEVMLKRVKHLRNLSSCGAELALA